MDSNNFSENVGVGEREGRVSLISIFKCWRCCCLQAVSESTSCSRVLSSAQQPGLFRGAEPCEMDEEKLAGSMQMSYQSSSTQVVVRGHQDDACAGMQQARQFTTDWWLFLEVGSVSGF